MENKEEMKFDMSAIDQTFTAYKKGQMFDGVVVIKREDGVIFNIGGKNDAFIPKSDFDEFDKLKIGDRFQVIITKQKNEDGMIEVSKRLADDKLMATQNALKLKLGSNFSFVVTGSRDGGLVSKMGEYEIFIPENEIFTGYAKDVRRLIGRQFDATVTEIDKESKKIVGSVKMLAQHIQETNENLFWNSIFLNKIVHGKIKKIMPYGAFVEVDGVDCFLHISNIAYQHLNDPCEVLKEGQSYDFKVIELDRDNKKVALSLKALQESPKTLAIRQLQVGETYEGEVVKILKFGAILQLENGASGLLHISNATEDRQKQIYEIVKLGQRVSVVVVDKDDVAEKVSFALPMKVE